MSTVLDHLVTRIVDVPKNGACDAYAKKAFDYTQFTGTRSTGMVALPESIICARRHRPEPHGSTMTGDWKATRTDSTLTRGKRLHQLASAAGFRTNTDGCYGHCNPPSRAHAVAASRMPHSRHTKNVARKILLRLPLSSTPPRSDAPAYRPVCDKHYSCRTSVVTRVFNARGIVRSQALWQVNFTGEPESPPTSLARTRARDGTPIAPPPQTAQPRPKPFFCTASSDQRDGLIFHLRHFQN
ncbi:hypothetical protein MOQ_007357 [Trypanosoma cruzi marinkellei]|uniref:Uncharacterized protein n=1 Tax=Trypanosoma cruzi marinkellei TaxID=85056 RepID=K2M1N8_TRYCR|nr:hypothetical protein MOQ_007357 [Trypanosoma cruzi marinkellei]